jgi:hypothetical protein
VKRYLDKYVFGVPDFGAYLEKVGGKAQLERLARIEHYQEPMTAPWARARGGKDK